MGFKQKINATPVIKMAFVLFFFVFGALNGGQASEQAALGQELQEKLTMAFSLAFKEAKEFKATRLFQELGYDLAETSLIASITPRPQELWVEAELAGTVLEGQEGDALAFESLSVACRRVHYFGMIIERVEFGFAGAVLSRERLERGELRFLKAQEVTLKVQVSEADIIAAFGLFVQARSLRRLKMSFEEDVARLTGSVQIGVLPMSFEVMGAVELANPKQINFLCERLAINRQLQPRNFVVPLFAAINPVFDSSKIWLNIDLTELRLIKGFVSSTGVIRPRQHQP